MLTTKQFVSSLIAIFAFVYTFYTIGKLINFLSPFSKFPTSQIWIVNLLDNKSKLEMAFDTIKYDAFLIIIFILQHSLMKSSIVGRILKGFSLEVAERAIYCIASCYTLLFLMKNWKPTPFIFVWKNNTQEYSATWWSLIIIHTMAWIIIYGGNVIMDLPELIGIKQVFYNILRLAPPICYKCFEFQRLYNHFRHPSLIGLTAVLWSTNCMTLDRFILSSLLTIYMYIAWSTDEMDIMYVKRQLDIKRYELRTLINNHHRF